MNPKGLPLESSNWGERYQSQGILAPGENILGASPGGGTTINSGTSFATPVVSGVAALLLSLQLKRGQNPNPHTVRESLLKSALGCDSQEAPDCRRLLVGRLNLSGAQYFITQGGQMLKAGDAAPDFTVKDHTGRDVRLSDYRGKTVVLWFYPEADTPG